NDLKPGTALPSEGALAQQLGVGRNAVREAVKSLETLGILEVRVGSGLYVSEVTAAPIVNYLAYATLTDYKRLADLREVRRRLEIGFADRVIANSTDEQVMAIRGILDEWRVEAAAGRYPSHLDRAFHEALWGRLDNEILTGLLDAFFVVQDEGRERGS